MIKDIIIYLRHGKGKGGVALRLAACAARRGTRFSQPCCRRADGHPVVANRPLTYFPNRNLAASRGSNFRQASGAASSLSVEGKEAPWPRAPSRWGNVSDGVQRDESLVDAAQSTR